MTKRASTTQPDLTILTSCCRGAVAALTICLVPALLSGSATTALAQGSLEDYARADNLRTITSGKVYRDRVEPNWIGGSPQFWYRVQTGQDRHAFILVDAGKAAKAPAFDHDRLASALTEQLGSTVDAAQLPFQSITFTDDGNAITFSTGGAAFRYQLAEGILTRMEPEKTANGTTVRVLPAIRSARTSGDSTEITFINKTGHQVLLFWVSNPDKPTAYGSVDAGQRLDQHTYAGHVWLATDVDRKPIGVFEATASPGIAVIDGSWKPGEGSEDAGREDGGRRDRGDRTPPGSTSPDGNWRAEISGHNVVITDTRSGDSFPLTDYGTEGDPFQPRFHWSPDSRRLVVIREKQADPHMVHIVESSPEEQLQPRLQSFEYTKPGDPIDHPRPHLFAVDERREIPVDDTLFANPWSLSEFRWNPDSTRFSFLYNQRGHQVLRVVAIDAESGGASALIEETPGTFVCYSSKTFYHPLDESGEIIWMSERDGWNHLYLFDAATGELQHQLTSGAWVVRGVDRVDPEKRQVWFQAGGIDPSQDPYHVHYCRIDFDGRNLVRLTAGDGTHSVEYSPDGEFLVDTWSRVDHAPVTELRRTADGALVLELEVGDPAALLATGWQWPERFHAKGRDGHTDIHGVIYKPTNFDPAKQYPVIEKIYAGPHSAHVPKRFSANGEPTAELGFIIVQIDGMGTSHRSKAFHDVCWQNIGDAGFPDRVLWIKAAAATRPWMDLSRVGIFGGSAGGQNALRALIAHHDFYHVAVADCGCHDNRMDKIWWNEQWMGYPVGDHYGSSSNVDQAHRMQGKLMLIVGELDRNVDPASTMQVANALIKADKDFDLVVIPGAGHGAAGTPYGKRRQRDFLVRHLLGVEPRHVP